MTPSVGRIVHYHPHFYQTDVDGGPIGKQISPLQPYMAQIVYVAPTNPVTLTLVIWNHYGEQFVEKGVREGTEPGTWSWPLIVR